MAIDVQLIKKKIVKRGGYYQLSVNIRTRHCKVLYNKLYNNCTVKMKLKISIKITNKVWKITLSHYFGYTTKLGNLDCPP